MIKIHPVTLEGHGIRLEPLAYEHHDGLAVAAADGRLWELWFTDGSGTRSRHTPTLPTRLRVRRMGICCHGRYGS